MQWLRTAFAFMLILALVPALSVTASNVSGQGYLTITTQTTVLTLSTSINTLTTATNVSIYPATMTLFVRSAPYGGGYEQGLRFSAVKGNTVYANITSNTSTVTFVVMADAEHANWVQAGYPCFCDDPEHRGLEAFAPLVLKNNVLSAEVKFVIPSDGEYWFMFFNYSSSIDATIKLDAAIPHLRIVPVPSSTSSLSTTELLTLTTTANPAVGLPFGNLSLLGAVVAVAVIAGVLVIARRRKTSVTATLVQERPATVLEPPKVAVAAQPVTPTKTTQPQPVITEIPPIISTGYADLDKALNGGIPEEFAVVIVSPSFDERDLLLRKVVNSALSSGRLAILISNDMGRSKDMASRYPNEFYALSPQADRISQHGPNLLKIPSFENLSEANISLGLVLKNVLAKEKATKRIMIIDILSDLLLRYKSVVTRRWLTDFVGKRKAEGFTIIATLNPLTTTKEETQNIIDFFDGVIEIFEKPLMERSRRFLMIRKMYGQRYSDNEVLMDRDKLF